MALESSDEKILELIARPRAPAAMVRLCRCVDDASAGLEVKLTRLFDAIRPPCTKVSSAGWRLASGADMENDGVKAVTRGLRRDVPVKVLIGEIPLPPDMTPSFSFARLALNVSRPRICYTAIIVVDPC